MSSRKIKYNPAFLSDEELINSFAVHQPDLDLILQSIRENSTQSNQHWMLIGPRGIGKTMLALRAVAEVRRDKDLQNRWYPIVFGEESYEVSSPGRFWLEALLHLGQQTQDVRWQCAYTDLRAEREDRLRERALGQLMDFADTQNKRLLLVVENLHMLLGEQIREQDAWVLRDVLLNEKRIMLLGSATSRFKEITQYRKAFYEVFRPLEIKPLSTGECASFWLSVTGREIDSQHIRPIEILTGGNPRLLMIVASVEKHFSLRNLLEDLEQWIDDHTDYLKSFLDNLAATERRVYLALAEIWDPATAKVVAEQAGLGVNVSSSLLKRLVERGAVLSLGSGTRKNEYKVAERLYNIYYLMRRSGGASSRVVAVVKFMSNFYAPDELVEKPRHIAEEACEIGPKERLVHYYAYRDILNTVKDKTLRMELLITTPAKFFEADDAPAKLKELYNVEVLNTQEAFKRRTDHLEKARTTESLIVPAPSSPDAHWLALLKRAKSFVDQSEQTQEVERLINDAVAAVPNNAESQRELGEFLHRNLRRLDAAEAAYRKAIELKPDLAEGWVLLGQLLHEELKRFPDAEAAYRKAIELEPNVAWGWAQLGRLLHEELKRFPDAEAAYRKAIELEPNVAWGWAQLGRLLHEELKRFPDAEAAYRKAIELKPDVAWASQKLLSLLLTMPNRLSDAIEFFEASLRAHPNDAEFFNGFAWQLFKCGQTELLPRAEQAARRAVELDPASGPACHTLATILCAEGKASDALEPAQKYLQDMLLVEKDTANAINLLVDLAAAGQPREALRILQESPSSKLLEPLIVGIRLFLKEEVKVAAEIHEVGKDVAKRIQERQENRRPASAGSDSHQCP
jgi:tetratricopeptide (TPR) repeat protein